MLYLSGHLQIVPLGAGVAVVIPIAIFAIGGPAFLAGATCRVYIVTGVAELAVRRIRALAAIGHRKVAQIGFARN